LEIFNANPDFPKKTQTFPGVFSSLEKIAGFVCSVAADLGFDSSAVYSIETAVDEACSNIIEHAYGGEGRGMIEITCIIEEDQLKIIIHDTGQPFDLDRVPEPDFSTSLEDRPAHGLGIYIMRKWMDEVCFEFTANSGNYLTLVKKRIKR